MVHNGEVNSRFKVREVEACFLVVHRFFWHCTAMRVYVQAPTTVFNDCYMTHQRFAKDLRASVPGGLGGASSIWSRALV